MILRIILLTKITWLFGHVSFCGIKKIKIIVVSFENFVGKKN